MRFPGGLEKDFLAQREQEFHRIISEGGPLLIALYLLVACTSYFVLHPHRSDYDTWLISVIITGTAIGIGLLSGPVPLMRRNYQLFAGLSGGIVLYTMIVASLLYQNRDLAQHATYIVMLAITISNLALRLLLPVAIVVSITAGGLGLFTGVVLQQPLDWLMLTHYLIGPGAISLFIAYLLERLERRAFLQSLLLQWESRQLDIANRKLDELARRDPLTGLANRRHLDETLQEEWERARRDQQPVTLIFIDIDHFKAYNDHYGHPSGDTCLMEIGKTLQAALHRPGDLAARFGGEEFVLLLPNTDAPGAVRFAKRILKHVDNQKIPHDCSPTADVVTVSIGVATRIPDAHTPLQTLVDMADEALYASKAAGRHRVTVAASANASVAQPAE